MGTWRGPRLGAGFDAPQSAFGAGFNSLQSALCLFNGWLDTWLVTGSRLGSMLDSPLHSTVGSTRGDALGLVPGDSSWTSARLGIRFNWWLDTWMVPQMALTTVLHSSTGPMFHSMLGSGSALSWALSLASGSKNCQKIVSWWALHFVVSSTLAGN